MRGTIIRNNVCDVELIRPDSNPNLSLVRFENNVEKIGKSAVGLVDPEGGNYSPKDDAKYIINQSALNGNYQPEDIEDRKRDQYPDIGAYEGKSNNSIPPPTNLPPTNLPSIGNDIEEPAVTYDGTSYVAGTEATLVTASGEDVYYGIGGSYKIGKTTSINADYMKLSADDGDGESLNLSVNFDL